ELLEKEFFDTIQKLARHPKFAATYGPVSFRPGEHKGNIDFLKQLIQFGADTLQQKIEQAMELLSAERQQEAWDLFREVMDDPDVEIQHLLTIGDVFLDKKRWLDAQQAFAKALAMDPNSIHVLNRMAISYRKDKKYDDALATYRK
ncbi:MAG: hypothetical protein HQK55_19445, partial [Deltaproteobacteria bacterium]|nr:hypothetical protein [Deltaproteobacteria bacterium]